MALRISNWGCRRHCSRMRRLNLVVTANNYQIMRLQKLGTSRFAAVPAHAAMLVNPNVLHPGPA